MPRINLPIRTSSVRASVAAAAASLMLVASAHAAGDAAKERQLLMSNVGAATKAGAAIAKGDVEFDAAAAQLVLRTMNSSGLGFGYMFPEGSETGSNTEAAPAIWSDRDGFNKIVAEFTNATAVTVTDLASFQAAFGAATATCGTCHKAYRVKK